MTAFILTIGALAILATASKATPRKWVALLAICILLLAVCSAGGADSYYNDTPSAAQSQPIAVPLPTEVPTLPPQPTEAPSKPPTMASGSVMTGDDYAINALIALGGFLFAPVAMFTFVFSISGPMIRRYILKRGPQHE
jgi:hypothetical protein